MAIDSSRLTATTLPASVPLITSSATGVAGNGESFAASLSGIVNFYVGSNASNLVAGDTNGVDDIFTKNLTTGLITRLSTTSTGTQANGASSLDGISDNGNIMLFSSAATNLFAGGSGNSNAENISLYVKNLTTGVVTQVDTSATGVHSNGTDSAGLFLHDNNLVGFESDGSNLVAGDTNNATDLFIKNLTTGAITRVSTTSAGVQANGNSSGEGVTTDDNQVFFDSDATNLTAGDTNNTSDIFVKNLTTGAVTAVSANAQGAVSNGLFSDLDWFATDGSKAIFDSDGSNLLKGDTNNATDIFEKDLKTGDVTRLSTTSTGAEANGESNFVALSADGSKMLFTSSASNLVTGDTNNQTDLFMKDLKSGEVTRIFAAPTAVAGQDVNYSAEFADDDSKVVINYSFADENAFAADEAALSGLAAIYSVYVETIATGHLQLIANAASTVSDTPDGGFASDTNLISSLQVTSDGEHFVLLNGEESFSNSGSHSLENAYLVPLSSGTLFQMVGDATANTLTGTAGGDNMYGQGGNDTLNGGAGNDLLNGGAGADTMVGGAGDDTYVVDNAGDKVTEGNNAGTDTVLSSVDFIIAGYIENVTLSGAADIKAVGNGEANTLIGNSGNNLLNGGQGADTMEGGAGNDTYYVDNVNDKIVENVNEGTDIVYSAVTYTLPANVETLILNGYNAVNATGNALGNTITGNGAANIIDGGDGNDILRGLGGNDTLTGGAGADSFVFQAPGGNNGLDHITDFVTGTDKLIFHASDFGFTAGHHLTADEFHVGARVGTNGQFIYNTANHTLYWDPDGTGSAAAASIAVFDNAVTLHGTDFGFV